MYVSVEVCIYMYMGECMYGEVTRLVGWFEGRKEGCVVDG